MHRLVDDGTFSCRPNVLWLSSRSTERRLSSCIQQTVTTNTSSGHDDRTQLILSRHRCSNERLATGCCRVRRTTWRSVREPNSKQPAPPTHPENRFTMHQRLHAARIWYKERTRAITREKRCVLNDCRDMFWSIKLFRHWVTSRPTCGSRWLPD